MKVRWVAFAVLFVGCAAKGPEVRRLSPLVQASRIPEQCRLASVWKDSAAEKAGLAVGDVVESVNGRVPSDAAEVSDLVGKSADQADLGVVKAQGARQTIRVALKPTRPRLGAVCDLSGWSKKGVTAAGNESLTVFNGPYAMTASAIVDKGIAFIRVRFTNNADSSLTLGPEIFQVVDSLGTSLPILSPKEVICILYGDKGAHLLALKKQRRESVDTHSNYSTPESSAEERCAAPIQGRLMNSDPQYVEANAQYVAMESMWPSTYASGAVADGLIYLEEPSALPITVQTVVGDRKLSVQLGIPKASETQMKASELVRFFESQKKGTALRLTLRRGRVFVGKFSSYDPVEERAWFDTPSGGMLSTTSYSMEAIRYAESLETVPAKPVPVSESVN